MYYFGELKLVLPTGISQSQLRNQFPNFLCIGAQKAGTSWVYENLKKHPEIFIPENRYIHYFDRNFHTSYRAYLNHFKSGSKKLKGEVIPGYGLISRRRIQFIKKQNPNLKLILILRDPITRAWSHAKMVLLDKNNSNSKIDVNRFNAHFNSRLSSTKGDYKNIIENWLSVFDKEQLLIIYNEEVKNSPERTLKKMYDHLGVSTIEAKEETLSKKIINQGVRLDMPEECLEELKQLYKQRITNLEPLLGENANRWYNKYYS